MKEAGSTSWKKHTDETQCSREISRSKRGKGAGEAEKAGKAGRGGPKSAC